ncbi:lambda-crystallin homolog [Tubulanus polymorphus]|uniref:lambda-crystallin homolog n=1 Tax=Tubulanus polymorphus TaxID=672921 RepID=UPI003DA27154
MKGEKICIVGSGLIGRSWAMIFASADYNVVLYDISESQTKSALEDIGKQLHNLEKRGYLKGKTSADHQFSLIATSADLASALKGAKYCQECVPEDLELKKKVHSQIDELADETTIVGSSSSFLACSLISEHLKHRNRVTIAHPVNPPYYIPLVELSPAPWTDRNVVEKARAMMTEIGQAPVTLNKEMIGFAANRIQSALQNECFRLVADGVMNVADVDTLMHSGLGPRYAFLGPLCVSHLNGDGMKSYIERYGPGITRTTNSFGPNPVWSLESPGAAKMIKELDEMFPLRQLQDHRMWRDSRLAALAKLKSDMKELDE